MAFIPVKNSIVQGDTGNPPSCDAVYNFVQGLVVGPAFPYFGSFYDTTTQLNSPSDTPRAMTYNTVSGNYHVSIKNGSKISFDYSGTYNIQFSAQFVKNTGTPSTVNIWLRQNGTDVPWSDTEITLANSSKVVASWNFVVTESNTSYLEIYWASSDGNISILSKPSQTTPYPAPGIPSIILTVTPVKAS